MQEIIGVGVDGKLNVAIEEPVGLADVTGRLGEPERDGVRFGEVTASVPCPGQEKRGRLFLRSSHADEGDAPP